MKAKRVEPGAMAVRKPLDQERADAIGFLLSNPIFREVLERR